MSALPLVVFLIACILTFVSALALFPLLRRGGVVDVPSNRSSHSVVTVRGGGLAVGCGITIAVVVAVLVQLTTLGIYGFGGILMPLGFLVLTWCYSVVGLSDDLDSLGPLARLIGQAVLALIFSSCTALFAAHGIPHVLVFAAIGVIVVNATNFVDGLNGFVSGWAAVTGTWYAFAAYWVDEFDVVLVSLALAGACLGFLPFNLGKAKAFLGDTGSYGIGAAIFALSVWLFVAGVPIVVVLAPLIFVLFDVGLTLVQRLFRGENIFLPHREHIYQRIQASGWSHESVSLFHVALTAVACVLAAPTLLAGNTASTYPAHVFWAGLIGLYALAPIWLRSRVPREGAPS